MVKVEINIDMVYQKLDRLCGEVSKVRERMTAVETSLDNYKEYQLNHDAHKYRNNIALIAIMGVVLTAVNVFI